MPTAAIAAAALALAGEDPAEVLRVQMMLLSLGTGFATTLAICACLMWRNRPAKTRRGR